MKQVYVILVLITVFKIQLYSQTPKVYIHLNSHNEATGSDELNYDDVTRANYDTAFKYIKKIADMVIAKNAKFNFQSDVRFLFGCLKWDLSKPETSNKNLLKWMDDSPNIECDPHSHEGKYPSFGLGKIYNYSDVAHLHDSLGVTNRKNVGGFKVDGLQTKSHWPDFEAGQPGKAYSTSGSWKPNVLWGGSYKTGFHNDMNFFGTYKPKLDTVNYASPTTNANQRLRIQGNGCPTVFHDTTNEQRIIKEITKVFRNVHNGSYSSSEFYTPIIQINCRDFHKPNFVSRLTTIVDSVNKYVTLGWVEWKTISEKDAIWKASPLDSTYKRIDCTALPTGIDEKYVKNELGIFPNPTINNLTIAHNSGVNQISIIDALGKTVYSSSNINSERVDVNTEFLKPGLYFVVVQINGRSPETRKILKE